MTMKVRKNKQIEGYLLVLSVGNECYRMWLNVLAAQLILFSRRQRPQQAG